MQLLIINKKSSDIQIVKLSEYLVIRISNEGSDKFYVELKKSIPTI